MDMITLAMAKAYSDSKGGYTKTHSEVLTFDGNTDGKVVLPGSLIGWDEVDFVKVADQAIPGEVCGITLVQNGKNIHYNKNQITVSDDLLSFAIDGFDYVISVNESASANVGVDVGTYFAKYTDGSGYVSEVYTESETIVPIDQKYLPGVCLPVVELSTTFASGADLTEEEDKLLKAAWENDSPIVVKCAITLENGGGYDYASAVWYKASVDIMSAFALSLGTKTLLIHSVDKGETWGCLVS